MSDEEVPDDELDEDDRREQDILGVVAKIVAGRCDGGLVRVIEAVEARTKDPEGPVMRWQVSYDGLTFTQDDLTLGDGRWIEMTTRCPLEALQPKVVVGHLMALVACAVARRDKKPKKPVNRDAAWEALDDAPLDKAECIDLEVSTPDPLSEG